ncbi:MAG: hypothetical protein GY696_23680 [Gammaproteobacteria bacterium]|nr:hypothetical protein [Gammaproteobacteria bacterium]
MCPASDKKCSNCGKNGHFAKVCQSAKAPAHAKRGKGRGQASGRGQGIARNPERMDVFDVGGLDCFVQGGRMMIHHELYVCMYFIFRNIQY